MVYFSDREMVRLVYLCYPESRYFLFFGNSIDTLCGVFHWLLGWVSEEIRLRNRGRVRKDGQTLPPFPLPHPPSLIPPFPLSLSTESFFTGRPVRFRSETGLRNPRMAEPEPPVKDKAGRRVAEPGQPQGVIRNFLHYTVRRPWVMTVASRHSSNRLPRTGVYHRPLFGGTFHHFSRVPAFGCPGASA